jgi:4-hydroxymandelate oxidase
MLGKLLIEGNSKLIEKGIKVKKGAETGSAVKLTRDYIDSLMIEIRVIDSVEATTKMNLFGEYFDTPVMVAPLSTFDQINKYFAVSNMPIASSQYWNMVHGY